MFIKIPTAHRNSQLSPNVKRQAVSTVGIAIHSVKIGSIQAEAGKHLQGCFQSVPKEHTRKAESMAEAPQQASGESVDSGFSVA